VTSRKRVTRRTCANLEPGVTCSQSGRSRARKIANRPAKLSIDYSTVDMP
jgi:hypothetical protein